MVAWATSVTSPLLPGTISHVQRGAGKGGTQPPSGVCRGSSCHHCPRRAWGAWLPHRPQHPQMREPTLSERPHPGPGREAHTPMSPHLLSEKQDQGPESPPNSGPWFRPTDRGGLRSSPCPGLNSSLAAGGRSPPRDPWGTLGGLSCSHRSSNRCAAGWGPWRRKPPLPLCTRLGSSRPSSPSRLARGRRSVNVTYYHSVLAHFTRSKLLL